MKRFLWGLILAATGSAGIMLLLAGCGGGSTGAGEKLKVTASFYPMAEFARQVGGDRVDVTTLIAPGVEPHDYDPSPRDIAGAHESRVFVYNGAGLEPWADKIKGELTGSGVTVVEATAGIDLLPSDETEEAGTPASRYDPHVWLDPVLAGRQVDNIGDGLIAADPDNRDTYEANAAAYKGQLQGLADEFEKGLASCSRRDIITSHQAFRYLAGRYNLDVVPIAGISPEEEPSPQKLAEISQFVRERGIKYVFFETLVSPKLAETIAAETGAGTLVFNPLEGLTRDAAARGENYLSVQRENLNNLKIALDCK